MEKSIEILQIGNDMFVRQQGTFDEAQDRYVNMRYVQKFLILRGKKDGEGYVIKGIVDSVDDGDRMFILGFYDSYADAKKALNKLGGK